MSGDVSKAVVEALDALVDPDPTVAALGAIARSLASDVDDRSISATQRAGAARALGDVLAQLRDLAPAAKGGDRLDELARARNKRRAG